MIRWRRSLVCCVWLGSLGCARGTPLPGSLASVGRAARAWPEAPPAGVSSPAPAPSEIAPSRLEPIPLAARHFLVHPPPRAYRDDCSGFVAAVMDRAGHPVAGDTRSLWDQARSDRRIHRKKRPEPGDLAFFDNTYDRDGDGRINDQLTHVAIVLDVDEAGTITLAHAGTSAGRAILRMNLRRPDDRLDEQGQVVNDPLRKRTAGDRPNLPTLAGQLWRAFASPPDGSSSP